MKLQLSSVFFYRREHSLKLVAFWWQMKMFIQIVISIKNAFGSELEIKKETWFFASISIIVIFDFSLLLPRCLFKDISVLAFLVCSGLVIEHPKMEKPTIYLCSRVNCFDAFLYLIRILKKSLKSSGEGRFNLFWQIACEI